MQNADDAFSDFEKAIKLNPEYFRSVIYCTSLRSHSVTSPHRSYMAQVQMAVMKLRMGRSQDLKEFKSIINSFPTNPDVYNYYAQVSRFRAFISILCNI